MLRNRVLTRSFVALWVTLFLCATVSAQTGAGSITGSVKDVNGAAVPGATVTLVNPVSSVSQTVTANEDGIFVSPQLPPGTYTVSVEKEGFKRVEKAGVILSTGDRLNAGDFVLEAGGVRHRRGRVLVGVDDAGDGARQVEDVAPVDGEVFDLPGRDEV